MLLDSLKEYHDKMNEIAEQKLQNIETNSKNEIDRVKLRAERDIQMLIEAEEVLAKPISGETLCVAMIPNSAGDESGSQEVTLYDRMKDFEIFLKNKQKQFDQLRNNWANLTGDLVRLIVEIVGTSSLGVEENQMPAGLITIFQEANAQHAEICQQYEEIISNLESFETRVADLADQSKNAMKKQQKVRKLHLDFPVY